MTGCPDLPDPLTALATSSRPVLREDRHFYYPASTATPSELTVVWGNANKCQRGYHIERDDYPYYALEYIVAGEGGFETGGLKWELRPGMLFGFAPHTPHRYYTSEESLLEKLCVVFHGGADGELAGALPRIMNKAFFVSDSLRIYSLFTTLVEEGLSDSPASHTIVNHILHALILKVADNIVTSNRQSHSYTTFLRCRGFMEEHARKDLQMSGVAAECNVDSSYMTRLFRKYMSCTPNQYHSRMMVERSMNLLSSAPSSIKEIAATLGFSNQYHFSSFFKKHVHLSPTEFRMAQGVEADARAEEADNGTGADDVG